MIGWMIRGLVEKEEAETIRGVREWAKKWVPMNDGWMKGASLLAESRSERVTVVIVKSPSNCRLDEAIEELQDVMKRKDFPPVLQSTVHALVSIFLSLF